MKVPSYKKYHEPGKANDGEHLRCLPALRPQLYPQFLWIGGQGVGGTGAYAAVLSANFMIGG
jgi:hypothetical protein